MTGFDRAPQRNLSDDTLTEHEQKNPSSNHAWPTSPRYLSRRRSTTTRRLDRGRLSTDQRPHNHHCPPASPVAGLGGEQIPRSFRFQQRPKISLRFALERLLTNDPQALARAIDELLIAAPLSQTSPRLRDRLRSVRPRRAAAGFAITHAGPSIIRPTVSLLARFETLAGTGASPTRPTQQSGAVTNLEYAKSPVHAVRVSGNQPWRRYPLPVSVPLSSPEPRR